MYSTVVSALGSLGRKNLPHLLFSLGVIMTPIIGMNNTAIKVRFVPCRVAVPPIGGSIILSR
jgi:hypothetical protein